MVERDDEELSPAAVADPVTLAIGNLLTAIIESTAPDSPERARAMTEALEVAARIKSALSKPRLN